MMRDRDLLRMHVPMMMEAEQHGIINNRSATLFPLLGMMHLTNLDSARTPREPTVLIPCKNGLALPSTEQTLRSRHIDWFPMRSQHYSSQVRVAQQLPKL